MKSLEYAEQVGLASEDAPREPDASGKVARDGKVAMARDGDSEQGRARHQRRREFRSGP